MDETHKKRDLWVISLVAIVNALGYGIIIPLQYAYVARFGINAFWLGVLFASYSLAQFIATPIIGRLSDVHGRKPLLFLSVLGTAFSFFLFALAGSAPMIFIARILDGITGGNISVAQAVVSDVTTPQERAKWFGILGAAFGFGFVFGPAIAGVLSNVSLAAPFYFAGIMSLVACLIIWFVQKESLQVADREKKSLTSLFDFKHLFNALFEPFVGLILIANFIAMFAFSIFILGFQAFTNDILKMTPTQISLLFVMFGVVGLIMQGFATGKLVKIFSELPLLIFGVVLSCVSFFVMGISTTLPLFLAASVMLAIGNSFLAPLITAILSKHTKKEDQGAMMGINQAYGSLANIIGPIIGGALAVGHVSFAFFGAGLTLVLMLFLTMIISRQSGKHVIDL
jgi:MFS family permease